ncbi:colanic acid biosynthesis glycosyltransferase WcaL, partial [Mesorhizobium sp. M00.F.Ca.ET.038.03.1.1]
LIRDPVLRARLGDAAERRVRGNFDHTASIGQLKELFEREWRAAD